MRIGKYNQKNYVSRINQVQDYIENHINETMSLEQLAGIAYFSPFYFHRLFQLVTGETLYQYIQRIRLEKSIFLLQSDQYKSITDIGLDVGFSTQASFAKAFKKAYGLSASTFRKMSNAKDVGKIDFESAAGNNRMVLFQNRMRDILEGYEQRLDSTLPPKEIRIEQLPAKELIYVRYVGPYKGNEELFSELFTKLYTWAEKRKLIKPISNWLVIYHDQSDMTEEDRLRVSVCLEIDEKIETGGEVCAYHLDSGSYSIGCFEVDKTQYQHAWDYMLFKWIPGSGYKVSDRVPFEVYRSNQKSENPEKKVVEICIPIELNN